MNEHWYLLSWYRSPSVPMLEIYICSPKELNDGELKALIARHAPEGAGGSVIRRLSQSPSFKVKEHNEAVDAIALDLRRALDKIAAYGGPRVFMELVRRLLVNRVDGWETDDALSKLLHEVEKMLPRTTGARMEF